ncbi:MAG: ubiquinone biosynthesis regulatory protein kinase UbiB [Kistimonas sp.]|nr:ubiquinone biosynthesis regulatory protein kinase UbiB [Kistimonas sp.]
MQQLLRILTIIRVIIRHRLHRLLDPWLPPWLVRLQSFLPGCRMARPLPAGVRLRRALTELGPVFIKFGQLLSTRRDLLPDDIGDELALLQDKVPAFAVSQALLIIEAGLGKSLDALFASFEQTPLASASVAQVHAARLHTGEEVVVKVIRPGIARTIGKDIALLYWLARLIRLNREGRRLRPVQVVADYERTIFDELNLQREAANGSQLRRNFQDSPLLYIPRIYWDYCCPTVMVMERVEGICVADTAALDQAGVDRKKLAERGVEIFFTQVFRDSFFHADMHPGNIFVSRLHPESPGYIAVDYGIVGSLTPEDQSYLARNLLAFFRRDYRQVARLHIDSGWVAPDTPVNELEASVRTVCEPLFARPLADISFGMVLLNLFQVAHRFQMEIQPQLILLQKTLLNIEGLGRQIYPQLDLWATAHPFLEKWMRERVAPTKVLRRLHRMMPELIEQVPVLAQRVSEDARLVRGYYQQTQPAPAPVAGTRIRRLSGMLLLATTALLVYLTAEPPPVVWAALLLAVPGGWLLGNPGSRPRSRF